MPSNDPVSVDTPERWRAISAPLRQRVLMLLEDGEAWSIRQLAHANGRSPQALYRHVEILASQGLIVVHEEPGSTSGSARRYRLAGPIRLVGADGPFADAYATCVDRMLRDAARRHGRHGPVPGHVLSSHLVYMTDDEASAVRARIRATLAEVRAHARSRRADAPRKAYSVLLAFAAVDLQLESDESPAGSQTP
jgi:DNA-binding transcriptional ArsR family regulator